MKDAYTQSELDAILSDVQSRRGWDFSSMRTWRAPVPWEYLDEVRKYLLTASEVLDIGTGGGERFTQTAPSFKSGVGIDIDPQMVDIARENARQIPNITFEVMGADLSGLNRSFDVIINRHAPFDLTAIRAHLKPGGRFVTQQVGEKNMANVKHALGHAIRKPTITKEIVEASALEVVDFREYNVVYVVKDIESLVFWLNALDMLHADIRGNEVIHNANTLNAILLGNVDERGFVTNEHRYLAVAKRVD